MDPDTPKAKEYLKEWTYGVETKTKHFARGRGHPLFVSTLYIYIYIYTSYFVFCINITRFTLPYDI